MKEKRRSVRKPFSGRLHVDKLYNQEKVFDVESVDVVFMDISRLGVKFTCEAEIPLDCYFNAKIELGEAGSFLAVLKVIRQYISPEGKREYGCEFVGLADILADMVDDYDGNIVIS